MNKKTPPDPADLDENHPLKKKWAEVQRAKADYLSQVLRRDLGAILDRQKNAGKVDEDLDAALRPFIETARIENLAEWLGGPGPVDGRDIKAIEKELADTLNRKGWARVNRANLDAALLAAEKEPPVYEDVLLDWKEPPPDEGQNEIKLGAPLRFNAALLLNMFAAYEWGALLAAYFPDPKKNWLAVLAGAWLKERAEAEAERLQRAETSVAINIRERARTGSGDQWTAFARPLDIPAALAGPLSVELDGETYAAEPEMAAGAVGQSLRPRGVDIVPADWLENTAQLSLSLDMENPPEALREYMLETAAKTAHLANLPNLCPKLLGFMFAAAPMTGRGVQGTLGELARWLYPDWTENRRSKRDLKGVGAAFVAIKNLRLVETEADGTRRPYDLFTMDYALTDNPAARVGWMVNPWLVKRMQGGKKGGFFLLNMTRWLALGIQNPRLFPLALRLAAMWDKARVGGIYNRARLQPVEGDRLAWECNTLPPGAAMYKGGKTDTAAGQVQLQRARANLEADLNTLRDAGLLGKWDKTKVHGKGFMVLPVPPEEYAEACKLAVAAGKRNTKSKNPRK